MVETISGIITAIVIIVISRYKPLYLTQKLFAATILVAIAFIYVGFSLKENQVMCIVLECGFALLLYVIAIIGYTRNNSLLAYGIILHGIWDILHHNSLFVTTNVPGYWPLYCFVIDIIDGIYFLMIFKNQKTTELFLKKEKK